MLKEKTTTQGARIRGSTTFPRPAHYRPPYTERGILPHPIDLSIDVRRGQVAVRSTGKDAKEEIRTEHIDLRPGLVNSLVLSIVKKHLADTPGTKVSMMVATPKPRLVRLAISPRGEEYFSLVRSSRKAMRSEINMSLGGMGAWCGSATDW